MSDPTHLPLVPELVVMLKSKLERNPTIELQPELNLSFNTNYTVDRHGRKITVELGATVGDKTETFQINCTYVGVWVINGDIDDSTLETFGKIQAPAQLVAYIREFLSSTSVRAGIPTIVLPPINVQTLLTQSSTPK